MIITYNSCHIQENTTRIIRTRFAFLEGNPSVCKTNKFKKMEKENIDKLKDWHREKYFT